MVIVVIIILLIAIIVLVAYNFHIQKKIEAYNNINQKISNLSVLQDFMKVAGEEDSVDAKLNKINEIVIEKYDIKYSTIVVFDGAEYVIKATNVDGIYNKDPKQFEDAQFIPHTSYLDVLNKKLKVMDSTAISLCMEEEIPILVFNIHKPGNLHKLLLGEEIGSVVS